MNPVRRTRWIDLGDTIVRYQRVEGQAPQLVLVHEMGGTLESWDDLLLALPPDIATLTYDLRGSGLSLPLEGPLRIDVMARDLARLLDAVGADGPVTIAACAFGAAVALQFAADFPSRVSAVVAMAPALAVPMHKREAVRARADAIEKNGSAEDIDARLAAPYPPVLREDEARFLELRARRQCASSGGIAAMLRLLTEIDLDRDTLPRVGCPVLVLSGRHDGDRPFTVVEQTTSALPVRTIEALETGHFMAWQTPQLLAGRIASFMTAMESGAD